MDNRVKQTLSKTGTLMRVSRETIKMLKDIGKKCETYDDIIKRLIEVYKCTHT